MKFKVTIFSQFLDFLSQTPVNVEIRQKKKTNKVFDSLYLALYKKENAVLDLPRLERDKKQDDHKVASEGITNVSFVN